MTSQNPPFASAPPAPSPPQRRIVGHLPAFMNDRIGLIMKSLAEYGDVVKLSCPPATIHIIAHPEDVKTVLHDRYTHFSKGSPGFLKVKQLLGEGLLTSEGDLWRRQRRLAQPSFSRQRVARFATLMTETASRQIEGWQEHIETQRPLPVASEMMRLTLAIIGKALFGADLSEKDAGVVERGIVTFLEHARKTTYRLIDLSWILPSKSQRQYEEAKKDLDALVYRIIERRRREGAEGYDLISMLLQATDDETGEGMSDEQLRDEVMTMIIAGYETTSTALAWIWTALSLHPGVARRWRRELQTVLGDRLPTVTDLPELAYTEKVIKETMRLYPSAWSMSRLVVEDEVLSGYAIPAGSLVFVCPYAVHRHPEFWPNPEGFDPERFAPEAEEGRHRFAYLPFGAGPRNCIGQHFAMMELKLVLATIGQRYALNLEPGHKIEVDPTVTLRPKGDLPMRVTALV